MRLTDTRTFSFNSALRDNDHCKEFVDNLEELPEELKAGAPEELGHKLSWFIEGFRQTNAGLNKILVPDTRNWSPSLDEGVLDWTPIIYSEVLPVLADLADSEHEFGYSPEADSFGFWPLDNFVLTLDFFEDLEIIQEFALKYGDTPDVSVYKDEMTVFSNNFLRYLDPERFNEEKNRVYQTLVDDEQEIQVKAVLHTEYEDSLREDEPQREEYKRNLKRLFQAKKSILSRDDITVLSAGKDESGVPKFHIYYQDWDKLAKNEAAVRRVREDKEEIVIAGVTFYHV